MSRAAVFGLGSWGTAFGLVLTDAGTTTTLCGRRHDVVEAINTDHENPWYQKDIELPHDLRATTEPADALAGADLVVLAIPAQTLRDNLRVWAPLFPRDALLVSLIKGSNSARPSA